MEAICVSRLERQALHAVLGPCLWYVMSDFEVRLCNRAMRSSRLLQFVLSYYSSHHVVIVQVNIGAEIVRSHLSVQQYDASLVENPLGLSPPAMEP